MAVYQCLLLSPWSLPVLFLRGIEGYFFRVFSLSIISDARNARRMNHARGLLEDFYAGSRPGV